MKHKRVWTDEQRSAAAERMRKVTANRIAKQTLEKVRAPEVQAVLDTMTPERKAKLQSIQARGLAQLAQTKEGQEALARLEESKIGTISVEKVGNDTIVVERNAQIPPQRVRITEYLIRNNGNGEMVSTLGPCWCGADKRDWHKEH